MRSVFFSCADEKEGDNRQKARINRAETYLAIVGCLMRVLTRNLVEAMVRVKSVSSPQVVSELMTMTKNITVCLLAIDAIS